MSNMSQSLDPIISNPCSYFSSAKIAGISTTTLTKYNSICNPLLLSFQILARYTFISSVSSSFCCESPTVFTLLQQYCRLLQNKHLFLMVLQAGRPRLRCCWMQWLVKTHVMVHRQPPLAAPSCNGQHALSALSIWWTLLEIGFYM